MSNLPGPANAFTTLTEYISFLNAAFGAIAFFSLFTLKKIKSNIKKIAQKRVLGFHNNSCIITIPQYLREIYGANHETVLFEEVESFSKLALALNQINIHASLASHNGTYNDNEIHIGGPMANIKTSTYFHNFFPNFRQCIHQKRHEVFSETNLNRLYKTVIRITTGQEGYRYGDKHNEIIPFEEGEQDCAVFVKMTKNKFFTNSEKTIHLIFGGSHSGTAAAIDFFINNYSIIYKKYKRKPYFFALAINAKDGSVIESDGFIDLTNRMF